MSASDSPDWDDGPQPTAHEVEPGCSLDLDRRDFMKASAGAAAAIAAGGVSTGTVAADNLIDDVVDGIVESITGTTAANPYGQGGSFTLGVFVGAITSSPGVMYDYNTDPSADRLILHQLVHNEIEWMNSHLVNFGNYMTDSRPIASLEARHAMAAAWEEGAGSSEAYDRALGMIRQYYELPEYNHLNAGAKALLQLSYIANSGEDTDPPYPLTTIARDGAGGDLQVAISGERQEVEYELHDGTIADADAFDHVDHIEGSEGVVTMPVFEFIDGDKGDPNGEYTVVDTQLPTQDVLDTWDPNDDLLTGPDGSITFNVDGTEYRTNLRFTTQNVDDGEDENASQLAFAGVEWLSQLNEVQDLSDEVVDWYDQSFVEDIYNELDAGNLTPEQVRSPEGMARYLSGTDDVSSERFQIAWMQQFGFERADMSVVSGMEVEWTGPTDTRADPNPELNERITYPDEFVDDETYSGVLFGGGSDADVEAGGKYAIGETIIAADDDDNLIRIDPSDGSHMWESSAHNDNIYEIDIAPQNDVVYSSSRDGNVYAHHVETGVSLWSHTENSGDVRSVAVSADGNTVVSGDEHGYVYGVDTDDGSRLWEWYDDVGNYLRAAVTHPNEDTAFVSSGSWVHKIDLETGQEQGSYETFSLDDTVYDMAISHDGETLYTTGNGGGEAINTDDMTQKHRYSSHDDQSRVAVGPDDETVYVGSYGDEIYAFDTEDGEEKWHYNDLDNNIRSIEVTPDGTVYAGQGGIDEHEELVVLDSEGNLLWQDDRNSRFEAIAAWRPRAGKVDGTMDRSIMFDEGGQGQVDLWNGVVTINEMWDAGGATIEHVDHDTIADIEALEGTPNDIETIIDEMDQFDSEEDIKYQTHVIDILEFYDVDAEIGEEGDDADITIEVPDYERPEYDSFDSSEFAEAMQELEDKIAQLEAEDADDEEDDDDSGWGFGLPSFPDGEVPELLGIGIIGLVVLAVIGIVTDLIPGLGN